MEFFEKLRDFYAGRLIIESELPADSVILCGDKYRRLSEFAPCLCASDHEVIVTIGSAE